MRWLLVPKLKAYIASIPGLPGRAVSIVIYFFAARSFIEY